MRMVRMTFAGTLPAFSSESMTKVARDAASALSRRCAGERVRRGAVPRELTLDTTVTIPASGVGLVSLVDGRLQLHTP